MQRVSDLVADGAMLRIEDVFSVVGPIAAVCFPCVVRRTPESRAVFSLPAGHKVASAARSSVPRVFSLSHVSEKPCHMFRVVGSVLRAEGWIPMSRDERKYCV